MKTLKKATAAITALMLAVSVNVSSIIPDVTVFADIPVISADTSYSQYTYYLKVGDIVLESEEEYNSLKKLSDYKEAYNGDIIRDELKDKEGFRVAEIPIDVKYNSGFFTTIMDFIIDSELTFIGFKKNSNGVIQTFDDCSISTNGVKAICMRNASTNTYQTGTLFTLLIALPEKYDADKKYDISINEKTFQLSKTTPSSIWTRVLEPGGISTKKTQSTEITTTQKPETPESTTKVTVTETTTELTTTQSTKITSQSVTEPVQSTTKVTTPSVTEPVQSTTKVTTPSVTEPVQSTTKVTSQSVTEPVQSTTKVTTPSVTEPVQSTTKATTQSVTEPVQSTTKATSQSVTEPVQSTTEETAPSTTNLTKVTTTPQITDTSKSTTTGAVTTATSQTQVSETTTKDIEITVITDINDLKNDRVDSNEKIDIKEYPVKIKCDDVSVIEGMEISPVSVKVKDYNTYSYFHEAVIEFKMNERFTISDIRMNPEIKTDDTEYEIDGNAVYLYGIDTTKLSSDTELFKLLINAEENTTVAKYDIKINASVKRAVNYTVENGVKKAVYKELSAVNSEDSTIDIKQKSVVSKDIVPESIIITNPDIKFYYSHSDKKIDLTGLKVTADIITKYDNGQTIINKDVDITDKTDISDESVPSKLYNKSAFKYAVELIYTDTETAPEGKNIGSFDVIIGQLGDVTLNHEVDVVDSTVIIRESAKNIINSSVLSDVLKESEQQSVAELIEIFGEETVLGFMRFLSDAYPDKDGEIDVVDSTLVLRFAARSKVADMNGEEFNASDEWGKLLLK